ncbi:MAG: histidine phosphatase family protein [Chloracidobacterium sp.]|uniref:Histidine phosphatase family protein n=1 Tax=Chloracidobacterium validum TaxID=2821543 RepID=A0ABX8BB33_9BACT|nr:histidine phosphatase family protein [Chloracidobacterium validum]QUW03617.1 histidine phosphatase family protein [Chloracidobacterium validum]
MTYSTETRLLIIRHGQTTDGSEPRCHGWADLALSDEGVKQIERLARYLRHQPIDALYASDLTRSQHSARILATGRNLSPVALPALREINFGDLEGCLVDELPQRFPATITAWRANPATCHFPNGESFQSVKQRVLPTIERLLAQHAGSTIALALHSGVNRVILGWALGLPDEYLVRLEQHHGCLNIVTFGPLHPRLVLHNFVPEPDHGR